MGVVDRPAQILDALAQLGHFVVELLVVKDRRAQKGVGSAFLRRSSGTGGGDLPRGEVSTPAERAVAA